MNFVPSRENVAPKSNAGPAITGDCRGRQRVDARRCRRRWLDMRIAVASRPERRGQAGGATRPQRRRADGDDQAEDDQQPGDPGQPARSEASSARGATFRGSTMPGAVAVRVVRRGPHRGSSGTRARHPRGANRRRSRSKPSLGVMRGAPHGCPARVERRRRAPRASPGAPRWRRDFAVPSGIPSVDGDLRQRQVEVVMQDDERPLLGLEAAEAAFELVAVGDRRRRVGDGRGDRSSVSSTSTRWRRSRRASSMQARYSSRWSQASKRSGSRNVGRSRQARTSVSWTASLAWSGSRRMSQAAASSRKIAAPASSAKAS